MSSYISRDAVCPFYRRDDRKGVTCEGVQAGTSLRLIFRSEKKAGEYKKLHCCGDWRDCLVAKTLWEKYEKHE